MMSSTSAVSKPFRSTSARSTVAATCCGCRCESAPFSALPMPRGVRQASMMNASAIDGPLIVVTRLCPTGSDRHDVRMRIGLNGGAGTIEKMVEQAQRAEADGFQSLWYPSAVAGDPVTPMAVVGRSTSSIELGTSVLQTYTTHPVL